MDSTNISDKYYKLIGVCAGCSWKELRKSYKIQIQKFHPDRYEDESILKFDAEEHIKSLNLAYRYFQSYYKEHGSLPVNRKEASSTSSSETGSFKFEPEDRQKPYTPSVKKSKFRPIYTGTLITGAFISLAFYITSSLIKISPEDNAPKMLNTSQTKQIDNIKDTDNTTHQQQYATNTRIPTDPDKLFSYGSTMGKVIDAQGIPDKSINDKWYYGKSIVYFENGIVTNWIIDNDSPLNTTISVETESHRNISN